MAGNKIVHVRLADGTDYFFGSFAAIYDVLTAAQLGIGYGTLINMNKVRPGQPYTNSQCTIQVGEIHRKKTKRKNPNVK